MEDRRGFHWAWVILATCFVNLFINYSVRLGYGVVLPEMIRDLGFSRTAGGSIYNSYLFAYIAVTPLTGYLTDRIGARMVITACAFILGVGVLLMGTTDTLWTSCLFFAIVGLGATGMWASVITVVQRWFVPARRGLALGILSTGYGLGFATLGAVFPSIVLHFNWRYAWYFLGAAALVMVVVNFLLLRNDPESAGYKPWGKPDDTVAGKAGPPARTKISLVSEVFNQRTFWLIGASYFCISYGLYGITTFMVDYAKYEMGMPLEKASLLATIHGVCQVAGVLTVLPLSDVLGRKKTIFLSNSVITALLVGVLFVGHSWSLLFLLVAMAGMFYGVTFPMYGACAGDYYPKQVIGTVVGAWTPFYGLGAIVVHWVSGLLRDATGSYQQAFAINAVMAAVGLLLISRVPNAPLAAAREK
ncbi:MAG: MFS transporter [Deltaproteobacteria bacterium]|nr:MFS transporter [Deltaproteobacteria bacterium]